jgi:hypothetical protein
MIEMKIENIIVIKAQLESLFDMFYIAQRTKDGRRREKNIREARQAISDYSQTIPTEVMDHFIREVGANALNYQHADDISECISVLDSLIKEQDKK